MKLITVNAYEKALITKNGKLIKILSEGKHWVGFFTAITKVDITKQLILNNHMEVLLSNDLAIEHITFVDVKDNEIGIETNDGIFSNVLKAGRYGYWDEGLNYDVKIINMDQLELDDSVPKHLLTQPSIQQYLRVFPVESYQKGLLYVDGKLIKELQPGVYYFWKTNNIVTVKLADERIQNFDVVGQEILTKDKAALRVNFSLQYQITDIMKALEDSQDYIKLIYTQIQLVLREYIGTMTLDEILSNKESIGPYVIKASKSISERIGLNIISGGIKDIILPGDVKEIMNKVLIAQKKAQANTIMRQEETASTRSLLNTAKLMEQNAMLMKLKEMEYMEKIADKIGEISINGKGRVIDQLADLMVTNRS